jgi:hypothetical protein
MHCYSSIEGILFNEITLYQVIPEVMLHSNVAIDHLIVVPILEGIFSRKLAGQSDDYGATGL